MDEGPGCSASSPTQVFPVFASLLSQTDCSKHGLSLQFFHHPWLSWSKPDSGEFVLLVLLSCPCLLLQKNKQKKGCRCAALRELFTRKRRVFTDAFLRSSPYPWVPSVSEAVWSQLLLLALTGRYFGICGFYFSCGVAVNRSFRVFSFFAFVSFLTVKESKCLFTHPFCTGNLGLSE